MHLVRVLQALLFGRPATILMTPSYPSFVFQSQTWKGQASKAPNYYLPLDDSACPPHVRELQIQKKQELAHFPLCMISILIAHTFKHYDVTGTGLSLLSELFYSLFTAYRVYSFSYSHFTNNEQIQF